MDDIFYRNRKIKCFKCKNIPLTNNMVCIEYNLEESDFCVPCSCHVLINHYYILLFEDDYGNQLPKEVINIIITNFLTPLTIFQKLNNKLPKTKHKLLIPLFKELDNLPENDELKNEVADSICKRLFKDYYLDENLKISLHGECNDELIKVAIIVGKIFYYPKIIDNDNPSNIKIITRDHLIGKYVGHSGTKTEKLLEEINNEIVIFKDSILLKLQDSFGKESLFTIMQKILLGDNKNIYIFFDNNVNCNGICDLEFWYVTK